MAVKYSFCESVTASSISPWCIRELSSDGRMLGGGVQTNSLCGRVKSPHGWDIDVRVNTTHPHACAKCVAILNGRGEVT